MASVSETEMRTFFDRFATNFVALSDQSKEFEEYKRQQAEVMARLDTLARDNDILRAEIEELRGERDHARREAKDYSELATSYSKERDEWRDKASDFERRYAEANDTALNLNDIRHNLDIELADTRADRNRANNEVEIVNRQLTDLGSRMVTMQSQIDRQAETILSQRDMLGDQATKLAQAQDDLERANQAYIKVDDECASLRSQSESLRVDRDHLRSIIDDIRSRAQV